MKTKLLLRIAAVIMLLHGLGHTLAIITWKKTDGTIPVEVIQKMTDTHFSFQGNDATMANFFSGHGYAGTILLLLIVAVLWTVSTWQNKMAAKILWPTGFAILALAVDELIYFFPMAVLFSLIAAALVFLSIFRLNKVGE